MQVDFEWHWKIKEDRFWAMLPDDTIDLQRDSVIEGTVVVPLCLTQLLQTLLTENFFIQLLSPSLL